ncbi:hypothetical protein DL765_004079 [Monosporascus sp. GIB2]|nr:hypothetical protein DL765_004079 [Monosporascus sp. GIB2]
MDASNRRHSRGTAGMKHTHMTSRVSRSTTAARKFRGLTCANCRARKIRCEGGPPTCKTCEVFHDECRYDKTPPVSQVIALAKRLQEAEKALADMRNAARVCSSPSAMSSPRSERSAADPRGEHQSPHARHHHSMVTADGQPRPFTRDAHMLELDTGLQGADADDVMGGTPVQSSGSDAGSRSRAMQRPMEGSRVNDQQQQQHLPPPATDNQPTTPHLSVDEHGEICYYGATSAVHDPPQEDSFDSQAATRNGLASSTADSRGAGSGAGDSSAGVPGSGQSVGASMRSTIAAYARESATWDKFAIGNASLETGIPKSVIARLLHIHWTWVSPMFMWVYRPAFVRDMATGGRYYSEFLLTVICAHSSKYHDTGFADILLSRARRLLGTAVQQPSSIPTVQALLQLSARDLAHGSISRAWVYSGIAFRMASDLGLQHSGPGIRGIGVVDLEIRRRLFWSCYFWDKATSLYAGRLPAVTETMNPDTLDLLDDLSEDEPWCPYYSDALDFTALSHREYPPMKGHLVSCFVNSCRLSIIISDVIIQLYSKRGRSITGDVVRDIKTRLDSWRANSPAHLKYDPTDLPAISPPPHIIAQNLLYYATVILAHRPFWSASAYYQVCIDASKSIEKLILLLESTFGLGNITYLMGYCIYTGASAILQDAKSGQRAAHGILRTYLRALNAGMKKCPLLERSLHIIVKGLNRVDPAQPRAVAASSAYVAGEASASSPGDYAPPFVMLPAAAGSSSLPSSSLNPGVTVAEVTSGMLGQPEADLNHYGASTHVNSYIPAFPYLDLEMPLDFGMGRADFGMAPPAGSTSMLDCFPEMQNMDIGDLICSSSVV